MKIIRNRAKEQLPMVLLTLLSIVQALALELLWSHVRESAYLFELTWTAMLTWIQIGTSFLGIVVIWLVYASTAMRFRWVPTTGDSVYPFIIGLLEFILIETLAPEFMGLWFVCMAMIFGLMTWISHRTMRRARLDGENDEYFASLTPATARDFIPAFVIVFVLVLAGTYLAVTGDRGMIALVAVLLAFAGLVRQLIIAARFAEMSVAD
jgi:uncharacterized Tic20 family protein